MGKKEKKSLDESKAEDPNEPSYEERLQYVSVIAEPMASKKLAKKVSNLQYILTNNFLSNTLLLIIALQVYQKRNETQNLRAQWTQRRSIKDS